MHELKQLNFGDGLGAQEVDQEEKALRLHPVVELEVQQEELSIIEELPLLLVQLNRSQLEQEGQEDYRKQLTQLLEILVRPELILLLVIGFA